jgi:hypothetical protein
MRVDYLHQHKDFTSLLGIVGRDLKIDPALVEKDYWIMHCLHGLQQQGLKFELKGGTSLSKGFKIINRFSEDIDIRVEPPSDLVVFTGRNQNDKKHVDSRSVFYEALKDRIRIHGFTSVVRDTEFDDEKFRSGGIRLYYPEYIGPKGDLKDGVLLEVGFDDVAPNTCHRHKLLGL